MIWINFSKIVGRICCEEALSDRIDQLSLSARNYNKLFRSKTFFACVEFVGNSFFSKLKHEQKKGAGI